MNIHEFFKMGAIGEPMELSPVVLAFPPFESIIQHAKDQKLAIQEIKYILWKYTWNSPYNVLPEKIRDSRIKVDILGDANYEISEEAKKAANAYVLEYQTNEVLEMLYSARDGIAYIRDTFNELKSGESSMKPLDAIKTVNEMGKTMASLDLLIKAAKKRDVQTNEDIIRGGGKTSLYEE